MPWVKIPPERLQYLSLFGYDHILDDDDLDISWYHGPRGRMAIERNAPNVWVEDIAEAHQLGATSVLITGFEGKDE